MISRSGAPRDYIAGRALTNLIACRRIVVFTLYDRSYDWRFIPSTSDFDDSGSSACH